MCVRVCLLHVVTWMQVALFRCLSANLNPGFYDHRKDEDLIPAAMPSCCIPL